MITISKRPLAAIAVVALLTVGGTAPALAQNQANAPAIVVQVRNAGELIDDARYLAETVAGPVGAGAFEGLLQQIAPQGQIPGVDETRPLGLVVGFGQFGEVQMPVFFVPVRDQNAFRNFLKTYFLQEQKLQDDLYFYQSPEQAIYAKFTENECFLSLLPTALESPPDISKLPKPKRDIEVAIHLDRFPPEFLTALDAQLQIAMAQAQAAVPEGEQTESEQIGEQIAQDAAIRAFKTVLTEAATIGISFDVDQKNRQVLAAFSLQARPDTGLAAAIASFGKARSRFSAILSDEDLLSFVCAMPLNESIRKDLNELITQLETDISEGQDLDAKQAIPLIRAVRECLAKTDAIDFAAAVRLVNNEPVLVAAGSLADPAAIKRGVLAIVESDPTLQVEKNVAELDGADVIAIKGNAPEELVLAFTNDAFYAAVAAPNTALQYLREAHTAVRSGRAVSAPSFLVSLDAKKLLGAMLESEEVDQQRQEMQMVLEAIGDSPALFAVMGEARGGVFEARIVLQEGVLKAIGVVASMAAAEIQEELQADPNVQ